MGYIYKIINQINQKVYIGQTKISIEIRFKQHLNDAKRKKNVNRRISKAIKEYGKENFQIELLEECPNNLLNEREKYWIKKYNSFYDGYNATLGGEGGSTKYDYDLIYQQLLINQSSIEVAKIIECSISVVQKVAIMYNISLSKENNSFVKQCRKINQYSLDDEYIQSFDSIKDAGSWILDNHKNKKSSNLKTIRAHISEVCSHSNNKQIAYGYKWKYKD